MFTHDICNCVWSFNGINQISYRRVSRIWYDQITENILTEYIIFLGSYELDKLLSTYKRFRTGCSTNILVNVKSRIEKLYGCDNFEFIFGNKLSAEFMEEFIDYLDINKCLDAQLYYGINIEVCFRFSHYSNDEFLLYDALYEMNIPDYCIEKYEKTINFNYLVTFCKLSDHILSKYKDRYSKTALSISPSANCRHLIKYKLNFKI